MENMARTVRNRLSPWIESVILSYGVQEGSSSINSGRRLKAHVIGVGPMPQSQAQGSDSPTGLLFLSDGVLQIPAILTASAWEHLQDQEDRESFTSLLNTTVCIQDYRLQFHMAPEQTKCRFFLSVGELATTAAGPIKHNTPCCRTMPSVRQKICTTWRTLLGQEAQDSQMSQGGLDLSELLGEWQHDCLQAVLEDVRERRMTVSSGPVSPQPSTSTCTPSLAHLDTSTVTSWDVDRVRDKGLKCFRVPIKCLLIPEEDAQHTAPNVGSRPPGGLSAAGEDRRTDSPDMCTSSPDMCTSSPDMCTSSPDMCTSSEAMHSSVHDAEGHVAKSGVVEVDGDTNENSPPLVDDDMITLFDSDIRSLANPWDIFPPPCVSSSSSDEEATPTQPLQNPIALKSGPDRATILTSMQLPAHSSKEFRQTSEHGSLPPYQNLPHSSHLLTTAGPSASLPVSLPEPFTRLTAADELGTDEARPNPLSQESQILEKAKETVERKSRQSKRKGREPTPEKPINMVGEDEEEAEVSRSPPSWLFDSQSDSRAKEDSSHQHGEMAGTARRKTPTVHSDGRPFSYSYQVGRRNLLDFSHFRVSESWLHWAVKYLVAPKQTDDPDDASLTSSQTSDRTDITSPQEQT